MLVVYMFIFDFIIEHFKDDENVFSDNLIT